MLLVAIITAVFGYVVQIPTKGLFDEQISLSRSPGIRAISRLLVATGELANPINTYFYLVDHG